MSVLEDLYFGKLNPENTAYNNEYYKASKESFDMAIEQLKLEASHDCRDYLDHLCHARRQMELHHGKEMFRIGFALAMKISAEAYSSGSEVNMSCPFDKYKSED